jgi:hypothetical protein
MKDPSGKISKRIIDWHFITKVLLHSAILSSPGINISQSKLFYVNLNGLPSLLSIQAKNLHIVLVMIKRFFL